tara:strand:+ start:93 stop:338 length:246 start_codon:yes stop_codon:yes gene_type:complete
MKYEHWKSIVNALKGAKNSKETVDALMRKALKDDSGGDMGRRNASLIWLNLHPDREYYSPENRHYALLRKNNKMLESIFRS